MITMIRRFVPLTQSVSPNAILIILVLAGSFFIRIHKLDTSFNDEANRDYLIAHHVVHYGEIPLITGNGTFQQVKNSPLYTYLLALFLSIKDDFIFLQFVNIILQVVTVGFFFLIARHLFGTVTALIAAVFFSLNTDVLYQSVYIWQPHMMHPFIMFSYLMFVLSYRRTNYPLLLLSATLFALSGELHNSVFALAPLFLLLACVMLRNWRKTFISYAGLFITFLGTLLVCYIPVLLYFREKSTTIMFATILTADHGYMRTFMEFFENFLKNTRILLDVFFHQTGQGIFSVANITAILIGFSILIYFWDSRIDRAKKNFMTILCMAIGWIVLATSLLGRQLYGFHFTPVLGLCIILIAEGIRSLLSRGIALRIIGLLLMIFFIEISSPPLYC